jgi:AcrR family transcriptional regulator
MMGRRAGSRNANYEVTRATLLTQLRKVLAAPGGLRLSDRELAVQVAVEPGTLRHYFGDRDGIIQALFIHDHGVGIPALEMVANGPLGPLYDSLRGTLEYIHQGFKFGGLADVHVVGLGAGLSNKSHGMHYVNELLEPTLACVEARITRHQANGSLSKGSARHAALQLVCPALMVFLHQYALGGDSCRPLDISAFLDQLATDFIKAQAPPARIEKAGPVVTRGLSPFFRPFGSKSNLSDGAVAEFTPPRIARAGPVDKRELSRPLFSGAAAEFTPPRVARAGPRYGANERTLGAGPRSKRSLGSQPIGRPAAKKPRGRK